jgi:hypothetical protein
MPVSDRRVRAAESLPRERLVSEFEGAAASVEKRRALRASILKAMDVPVNDFFVQTLTDMKEAELRGLAELPHEFMRRAFNPYPPSSSAIIIGGGSRFIVDILSHFKGEENKLMSGELGKAVIDLNAFSVDGLRDFRNLFFDIVEGRGTKSMADVCHNKVEGSSSVFYAYLLGQAGRNVRSEGDKIKYLDSLCYMYLEDRFLDDHGAKVVRDGIEGILTSFNIESRSRQDVVRLVKAFKSRGDNLDIVVRRVCAKAGLIPDTVLQKASPDKHFPVNRRHLERIASMGVVDDLGRGSYGIPILLPKLAENTLSGRDCQTFPKTDDDDFIVVFKGSGSKGPGRVPFEYVKSNKYDVHKFHGGLMVDDVEDYVRVPLELRRLYRRLEAEGDPKLRLAAKYGAGINTFYEHVAVFNLKTVPQSRGSGASMKVFSVPQRQGLRLAGFPEDFIKSQRVLCYVKHAPLRLQDTHDIGEDVGDWAHAFGHFGYTLAGPMHRKPIVFDRYDREVSFDNAASRVLSRASAGWALFNYMLHHRLGGAANIDANSAGVFQMGFHNVDTEGGIYDTDTVWWPNDGFQYHFLRDTHVGDKALVDIGYYQANDNNGAVNAIEAMAKRLGLNGKPPANKAVNVYNSIYTPPQRHALMESFTGLKEE